MFIYKFDSWSSEAKLSGSGDARGNIAKDKFETIKRPVRGSSVRVS